MDKSTPNGELSTSRGFSSGSTVSTNTSVQTNTPLTAKTKSEPNGSYSGGEKIRVRSSDIRKAKDRVTRIEAKSAANEARQTEIALELNEAVMSQNVDKTKALQAELEQLQTEQENLLEEWSEAAAYFEELSSLNP